MRTTIARLILLGVIFSGTAVADPAADIDQLIRGYSKDPGATVQGLLKIMEESPESPGVPKAFAFLITRAGVSEETDYEMSKEFLARIEEHHGENEELAAALFPMIGFRDDEVVTFLEKLGDSKNEVVSGAALTALASSFEHDPTAVERYDKILQKQISKHPDLKIGRRDVTAYAKQKLFASQHLRIGKVAPEVEGEDAEGKKFKLSDYRGKVVFFNFWGDW